MYNLHFILLVLKIYNPSLVDRWSLQRSFVHHIDISSNNSLRVEIVVNTILASFAAHSWVLNSTEPIQWSEYTQSQGPQKKNCWRGIRKGKTHGLAASEMTPVLTATMPNCKSSETRLARVTSWVKIYDANPTSHALDVATTSSSVLKEKMGATGPKISSLTTVISALTLVRIVGSKKFGPKQKYLVSECARGKQFSMTYPGQPSSFHQFPPWRHASQHHPQDRQLSPLPQRWPRDHEWSSYQTHYQLGIG